MKLHITYIDISFPHSFQTVTQTILIYNQNSSEFYISPWNVLNKETGSGPFHYEYQEQEAS